MSIGEPLHPTTGADWRAFVDAPMRFVSRRWLGDCLGDMADEATLTALAQHPRFQGRLTQRLVQRHALAPPEALPAPQADDLPVYLLPPDGGDSLAHYCGAICHATAFVREIRAPRVIELKARFGEAAFATALAHRELAIADTAHADDDALEHAIARDGAACLAIWVAQQPAELAAWLRLRLAGDVPSATDGIAAEIHQRGAAIVRRAAAIIATMPSDSAPQEPT
ncbi:hypothetical protein SAMN05661010_02722 [Modicisalibacter muralis]|uniref:Uncharacterized protein n=1 Tax=Modicisalibacter muralis TaxID=119000 RepID=A0A1G9NHU6_9GAMM|nr:type III secretion protein [Halomonas muralis]SDL86166.1 hypothetical protein SAMN05661010_02722 [Halomonas muralis]